MATVNTFTPIHAWMAVTCGNAYIICKTTQNRNLFLVYRVCQQCSKQCWWLHFWTIVGFIKC